MIYFSILIYYFICRNDEMAYYDLPASLDYVLEKTNVEKLHYVGFSMGSAALLAMLSDRPEYNDKVFLQYLFMFIC